MEREPGWELGEQRYLPQVDKENGTSEGPLTGLNKSRADTHRLIDGEAVKALLPSWVGFRRVDTRLCSRTRVT